MSDRNEVLENMERGRALIPPYMWESIRYYVLDGVRVGGFLQALVSNDLIGAASKADMQNQRDLANWAMFLINCCPANCFGSPEAYEVWEGVDD